MSTIEVDTTRLPLLLNDLRLPAVARPWSQPQLNMTSIGCSEGSLPAANSSARCF